MKATSSKNPKTEEHENMFGRKKKSKIIKTKDTIQYVSRKEGGRGLASIEDSIDASIQRSRDYIKKALNLVREPKKL